MSKIEEATRIIEDSATATAIAFGTFAVGAAWGTDALISTPLVTRMIVRLGELFGQKYSDQEVMQAAEITVSRFLSLGTVAAKAVLGWIPLIGNLANAAVVRPAIELIGWAAYEALKDGRDITIMKEEDWTKYSILAKKHLNR